MIDLTTLAIAMNLAGEGGGGGGGISTLTIKYVFNSYEALMAQKESIDIPTGSLAIVSNPSDAHDNQVFIKQETNWSYLFKATGDLGNLENLIHVAETEPTPIPTEPKIWLNTNSEGIRVPTVEAIEDLEELIAAEATRARSEEFRIEHLMASDGGENGLGQSYVTPEFYGAVGDGETDDTEAIQQAVASGLTVHLLNTYKVTSTINIATDGCTLQGGKVGVIEYTGDNNCFHITANFTTISGLHIVGNGLNEAFYYDDSNWNSLDHVSMINIDGIKVIHGTGNKFSDFNISQAKGIGVYISDGDDNHFDNATITMDNFSGTCAELHNFAKNITFANCHFTHGYNGVIFSTNVDDSVSDYTEKVPTNCKFTACHFDSCLNSGAVINSAQNISFTDCFFSCRPNTGVQTGNYASNIIFNGCQFHFNHIGLQIGGKSQFIEVVGCSFNTNGSVWVAENDMRANWDQATDILITSSPKDIIITGCSFGNNLFGTKFYNNMRSAVHVSLNRTIGAAAVERVIITNNIFSQDFTWKSTNNLNYITDLVFVNNIGATI